MFESMVALGSVHALPERKERAITQSAWESATSSATKVEMDR